MDVSWNLLPGGGAEPKEDGSYRLAPGELLILGCNVLDGLAPIEVSLLWEGTLLETNVLDTTSQPATTTFVCTKAGEVQLRAKDARGVVATAPTLTITR